MTEELSEILHQMLPILQKKLNYTDAVFNLWFSDLTLPVLTDMNAIFLTSTKLRKKILSTKYKKEIEESLAEVIGFTVEVSFESADEGEIKVHEEEPIEPPDPEKDRKDKERMEELLSDTKGSLLDEYTFDNFIEGESNKFARAACLAVAKEPTTYNPLFIYGQSGLGKTHLLYAVINYIRKNHPTQKIVYKKSEEFINELIASISTGTTQAFKAKYRSADILLIDDIQFIAGKESTQEEFFHTFSALYEAEKQIILTSDRPPKDIRPLEDRLRTRFEGGLIADVQPPSFELRTAIISKKSEDMGMEIPPEMINYMAERLQNNIRQIEGVLKKLYAFVSLAKGTISKEKIDEIISIIDPGNIPTSVMVERIIAAVAEEYDVTTADIMSKKKTENIANARHVAIYLVKRMTGATLKSIGDTFKRDHTTVLSSCTKVELNIKTKKGAEDEINRLIRKIKGI